METKTIFKEGDMVFDIQYGWGKITGISYGGTYPIKVIFGSTILSSYTEDGRFASQFSVPTLSFTEYTLNGFSQERPKEQFLENRWYKQKDTHRYGFFKILGRNHVISVVGWYEDGIEMNNTEFWELITDSNGDELKELLTKEAIKRGFVEGAKVAKTGINKTFRHIKEPIKGYTFSESFDNIDSGNGNCFIFNNGIWATLEQPTPFLFTGKTAIAEIDGKKFKINIIEEVK